MTQPRSHPRHRSEESPTPRVRSFRRAIVPLLAAAALFLLGSAPAFAENCGMGNPCPVADTLLTSPGTFAPNQAGTVTATAHDPNGWLTRYQFTASAGLFSNGLSTIDVSTSDTTQSVAWTAPAALGPVTISVKVWDNGSFGGPSSGNVDSVKSIVVEVQTSNAAPVISSLVADPDRVFTGQASSLVATASDPDGDPITWSWSANLGSVTPTGTGTATFLAPLTSGVATVTLTVTDSQGATATRARTISVSGLVPSAVVSGTMVSPRRVAADAAGNFFVADPVLGRLLVLGSDGSPKGSFVVPDILSVAVDPLGRPFVGGTNGARLLDRLGNVLVAFDAAEGLSRAGDVAVDAPRGRYLVLFPEAARVVVFDGSGTRLLAFGSAGDGDGQFRGATGLAVDASGQVFVGDAGHGRVQVFDATGTWVRSFGARGTGLGETTQMQGVAVGTDGTVFVTDSHQSRLQVFSSDGTPREAAGHFGAGLGELMIPSGVAVVPPFGKVVVASMNASNLQVFDLAGSVSIPSNSAPTAPHAVSPLTGQLILPGDPVVLSAAGSVDFDFQPVHYQFELFDTTTSTPALVGRWLVADAAGAGAAVDVTSAATLLGTYSWHCRAWDGVAFSDWTSLETFYVDVVLPNRAPGMPAVESPAGGVEVAGLEPVLSAWNATDPDGNPLTYEFAVTIRQGNGFRTLASAPGVAPGPSTTSWTVPAGLLAPSQEVFWNARASDGLAFGDWCATADFRTPPFAIPQEGAFGNIAGGDDSRPVDVRYTLPAASADTTLWFEVWDASAGEIRLEVNGSWSQDVAAGPAGSWSSAQSIVVPAAALHADRPNLVRFATSTFPDGWGVRNVTTLGFGPPALAARPWNTVVDLSWKPAPPVGPGLSLRLFRATDPLGPWTAIADLPARQPVHRDTGLANGVAVYYRAAWVDAFGVEGLRSAIVSATPSSAGGVTPVTDLEVSRTGADLRLKWTPTTTEAGVRYYEVYRATFGAWDPDTTGFSNLLTTVGAPDGTLVVPGGADFPDDEWYSVIPLDFAGARGTP